MNALLYRFGYLAVAGEFVEKCGGGLGGKEFAGENEERIGNAGELAPIALLHFVVRLGGQGVDNSGKMLNQVA